MVEEFLSLPCFMWEGIFNIAVAISAGLIIAFVTTLYLKKKDELTRVAELILEKRVKSYKYILDFFVTCLRRCNSGLVPATLR